MAVVCDVTPEPSLKMASSLRISGEVELQRHPSAPQISLKEEEDVEQNGDPSTITVPNIVEEPPVKIVDGRSTLANVGLSSSSLLSIGYIR